MNKKKVILFAFGVFTLILVSLFISNRKDLLGSTQKKISVTSTSGSSFSFNGYKGEKIKFSFKSSIISGNLKCCLYDSQGNLVYELDKAKELEVFYVLNTDEEYECRVEYKGFKGSFSVRIYEMK